MNMLRVLLIDDDPAECERIATRLERAQHTVLPLSGFDEAAEALEIQRFDAVILPARIADGQLSSFAAKLRGLEASGRGTTRAPILTYFADSDSRAADKPKVDGTLPQDFEPILFAETVSNLASGLRTSSATGDQASSSMAKALPIFKSDEFEEQMGFDAELVVELIDLFLGESATQVVEMHEALAARDFPLLCRIAHTIKGSFGSFYAIQASAHAQGLEQAAKIGDAPLCGPLLQAVIADLDVLKPELLKLRNARIGS